MKKTIRVKAEVNDSIYKSEVDRNERCEEGELIACKRHIRTMFNKDGLYDVSLDYIIEK